MGAALGGSGGLMPRNWVRKFPKTTGVVFTGSCGHTYQDRVTIPYRLVGRVRTDELEGELVEWLAVVRKQTELQDCRTCAAGANVEETRKQVEYIMTRLDLPVPAPLRGTPRQVAYGEQLRFQLLRRAADVAFPSGWIGTMGSRLLFAGDGGRYSDDIVSVCQRSKRIQHTEPDPAAVAETLTGWLLGRAAMRAALDAVDWEDTAVGWMRMRLGRGPKWLDQHARAVSLNLGVIFAAAAVGSRTCWDDRFQAEAAFAALCAYPEPGEMAMLESDEGSFAERVQLVATMRALSSPLGRSAELPLLNL
jgi:hypothetical protein